jgi:uncharacterized protein
MIPRRALARLIAALPLAIFLAFPICAARAQDSTGSEPAIPKPTGFVNDVAQVMDESSRAELEGFLDQVKRKTGAQFAILTLKSTAPLTPSEYKVKVFERWGLGEKGKDNGVLMLVAVDEREVRFETGYGLEGVLPDGLQSRIFRDSMAPRFRAGDYSSGIIAGAQEVATRIAAEQGVTLEWNGRPLRYDEPRERRGTIPGWLIAFVVFIVISQLLRSVGGGRRRGGGWWWLGPGGFGGWGGGFGGGFGGGGGSSFGGFGGGSSGGGGGGGRW